MQISHQTVLRIIAISNYFLGLLDPTGLAGQNAVELKSCGSVNPVAFREDLLPIRLGHILHRSLVNMVVFAPILELGSTIVSP